MKNTFKTLALTLSIFLACSAAYADGNAFTPLNFENDSYQAAAPIRTSAASTTAKPVAAGQKSDEPAGNLKMQNAIINLDNAQVDVRNDLLNYKAKYSDVDAQYVAVKAERKALKNNIKELERKIKKIDKQKENIRKNMI